MDNIVDARGLTCPQPVIATKKALENLSGDQLITIVDNEVARDNVVKLAESMAMNVEVEHHRDRYHIHIHKQESTSFSAAGDQYSSVMLFSSDALGTGAAELGEILMKSFFYTLVESDSKPETLLFLNKGVYLTCEGSPILAHLLQLEKFGVEILSCGTCLDYYNLKGQLLAGSVTNMYAILEKVTAAERAITF